MWGWYLGSHRESCRKVWCGQRLRSKVPTKGPYSCGCLCKEGSRAHSQMQPFCGFLSHSGLLFLQKLLLTLTAHLAQPRLPTHLRNSLLLDRPLCLAPTTAWDTALLASLRGRQVFWPSVPGLSCFEGGKGLWPCLEGSV